MPSARNGLDQQFFQVRQDLENIWGEISEAGAEYLKELGDEIIELAKEYAPEDTGALRDTGRATVAVRGSGSDLRQAVSLTFGGDSAIVGRNNPDGVVRYAAIVHELHPTNSGYLQKAIQEVVGSGIASTLAKQRFTTLARQKVRGTRGAGRAAPAAF